MNSAPDPRNIISLDTAVAEIKRACPKTKDKPSPYFFLAGAGLSAPAIPLAADIQRACEATARAVGPCEEPAEGADRAEIYSHWFRSAYPHRSLRQEYLKEIIRPARITHATLRLADLLLQGVITQVVVTPNFDDLLSRALTLFGKQFLICDDPLTVERIDPTKSGVQVIHLHGSYWFYDCRNTNTEVRERSRSRSDTTLTMAALLDKMLGNRSPLVIGYSGWEGDVFMTALQRRLVTPLPYNLYWFCYRRDEIRDLPDFLIHPDVYFVVPNEAPLESSVRSTDGDEAENRSSNSVNDRKPTLSATTVLDVLLNQFGMESPQLTRDPLTFFADRLRSELPGDEVQADRDIYSFRSVLERVERAIVREQQDAQRDEYNERRLEQIREAVRRARYEEALQLAKDRPDFSAKQLRELLNTMDSAARAMGSKSHMTPLACDVALRCYGQLCELHDPLKPVVLSGLANLKGNAFYADHKYEQAIKAYDQALIPLANDCDMQMPLTLLHNNKGLALKALGKTDEALNEYEIVIAQLTGNTNDEALNRLAVALVFKGKILSAMPAREAEATDTFRHLITTVDSIIVLEEYSKMNLDTVKTELEAARATVAAAIEERNAHEATAANSIEIMGRVKSDPPSHEEKEGAQSS